MICKGFLSVFCHRIGGICFSADKSFVHLNITILFQAHQVGSQVAVSNFQHLISSLTTRMLITPSLMRLSKILFSPVIGFFNAELFNN
jgi:hypothetical protein